MSYVAIATENYDDVVEFYGGLLGFQVVDQWDRPNARGLRLDLGGMRLEIFDNQRERHPLALGSPIDRFHLVVEVDDIEEARDRIDIEAPLPQDMSWGARLFRVHDPDGVPVTFLQWISTESHTREKISGHITTGVGQGKYFTQLAWARRQFIDKLGIDPFPGTVNLVVDEPESMSVWDQLKNMPGVSIDNPNSGPHDCNARCYQVSLNGQLDAAIVFPEVADYSTNQIEIIAAVGIRDALNLNDDDTLILEIK